MKKITLVAGATLLMISFQNCAPVNFATSTAEKSAFLSQQTVFSTGASGGSVSGSVPAAGSDSISGSVPASGSSSSGSVPAGSTGDTSTGSIPAVPVVTVCDDYHANTQGAVALASAMTVAVARNTLGDADAYGNPRADSNTSDLCVFTDAQLPKELLSLHGLPVRLAATITSKCTELSGDGSKNPDETFVIELYSQMPLANAKKMLNFGYAGNDLSKVTGDILGFGRHNSEIQGKLIKKNNAFAFNGNTGFEWFMADFSVQNQNFQKTACDRLSDPLIIELSGDVRTPAPLLLTSQKDGIRFDILGRDSDPAPYAKKQISWYHNENYYFVALPNSDGEVLGANQLFGNHTVGPDGKDAADGYASLAKYDDNKDGKITKDDAVFSKLRLWKDENGDGIAQPNELHSLAEMHVNMIDLQFDESFKEVDQFGNQTRKKSVVGTDDGRLHLIFDLFFKLVDGV